MKPSLITLPKIYADWSAVGWAMVLGYAPAPAFTDLRPNGKPALREAVHDWEAEGGTLKETSQTKAARKAVKRKPAPRKAPGKKRAPMKKKRTKRK